jgi:hypothetical protein
MKTPDEPWKNELYKAHFDRWAAEEAAESERRRQGGKIAIWLDRAPTDTEHFTKDLQIELYDLLSPVVRDKGLEAEAPFLAVDSVDAFSGYTGQLIIPLAAILSPVVTHVLVAWLQRKPGRKIRVEFHPSGKVKTVEARTEEQVLSILRALDQEARAKASKAKPE